MERGAFPVLEIVTVAVVELPTETSPKIKIPVETEILGAATGVTTTGAAAAIPVPHTDTVRDPSSESLLEIVRVPDRRVPDRAPVTVGVKVTATAVLLPAPTVNEDGESVN
jgi:hypothetical protein